MDARTLRRQLEALAIADYVDVPGVGPGAGCTVQRVADHAFDVWTETDVVCIRARDYREAVTRTMYYLRTGRVPGGCAVVAIQDYDEPYSWVAAAERTAEEADAMARDNRAHRQTKLLRAAYPGRDLLALKRADRKRQRGHRAVMQTRDMFGNAQIGQADGGCETLDSTRKDKAA